MDDKANALTVGVPHVRGGRDLARQEGEVLGFTRVAVQPVNGRARGATADGLATDDDQVLPVRCPLQVDSSSARSGACHTCHGALSEWTGASQTSPVAMWSKKTPAVGAVG